MDKKEIIKEFILFMKKENGEECKELTDSEKDWIDLYLKRRD